MALSLSTSIATALFTCDVPNMVITTDRPSVDVALKVRNVTIFSTTYYASSGKVTVRDLSFVLESHFIEQNFSIASVDFEFQDGEVSVNGEVCTQRGKKLYDGDTFAYQGQSVTVKASE